MCIPSKPRQVEPGCILSLSLPSTATRWAMRCAAKARMEVAHRPEWRFRMDTALEGHLPSAGFVCILGKALLE